MLLGSAILREVFFLVFVAAPFFRKFTIFHILSNSNFYELMISEEAGVCKIYGVGVDVQLLRA